MENKAILRPLRPAAFAATGLVLLGVLLSAFASAAHGYLPNGAEVWCALGYVAVLGVLYALGSRLAPFLQRYGAVLLGVVAVMYFVAQLCLASSLRFEPAFDMAAVYQGGIAWADGRGLTQAATPTLDGASYYYYFPNNLGAAALLALVFRVYRLFGGSDYFACATVFNALLLTASLWATALAGRRLAGMRGALVAAAAFLLFPPFWFAAVVFYTDFLSLLFPVLTVALFLQGQAAQTRRLRLVYYLCAGLCAGLGAVIKMTVVICAVAILLCLALRGQGKRLLVFGCCMALGLGLFTGALNAAVYPAQLDPAQAKAMNTPAWHWVMMGLNPNGNGGYDPAAYELTRSYQDPAQRKQAVQQEALRRLNEMGLQGFLRLGGAKWEACFGTATLNLSDMLDDEPAAQSALHDFLLPGGSGYNRYKTLCAGWLLCTLLAGVWVCVRGVQGRCPFACLLVPMSVAGLAIFLLFWETSPRYITNFMPLLALCPAAVLAKKKQPPTA